MEGELPEVDVSQRMSLKWETVYTGINQKLHV